MAEFIKTKIAQIDDSFLSTVNGNLFLDVAEFSAPNILSSLKGFFRDDNFLYFSSLKEVKIIDTELNNVLPESFPNISGTRWSISIPSIKKDGYEILSVVVQLTSTIDATSVTTFPFYNLFFTGEIIDFYPYEDFYTELKNSVSTIKIKILYTTITDTINIPIVYCLDTSKKWDSNSLKIFKDKSVTKITNNNDGNLLIKYSDPKTSDIKVKINQRDILSANFEKTSSIIQINFVNGENPININISGLIEELNKTVIAVQSIANDADVLSKANKTRIDALEAKPTPTSKSKN